MSRTTACVATVTLLAASLLTAASPALALAPPQVQSVSPMAQTQTRAPANAETRAAYDRADALSRSVFWGEQAEIDPTDPVAGVKAAQAMRELGRYTEAAEMAERVLMTQPQNIEAMLEAGRGHIARGQAFYGIATLEKARDARPSDWRPWSLLGTAYEQVRRPQDAQAAWAQALAIAPENPDVLTNMAMAAMTQGDINGAEGLLRRAAAQPGASLKVRLNLAMALGLNGKMDEAEQMMRRDLPPEAADQNLAWLRARNAAPASDAGRTWTSLQAK